MSERIVTYRSENADPGKEWLARIETDTGTMAIFADGPTEVVVIEKMTKLIADEKAKGHAIAAPRRPKKAVA